MLTLKRFSGNYYLSRRLSIDRWTVQSEEYFRNLKIFSVTSKNGSRSIKKIFNATSFITKLRVGWSHCETHFASVTQLLQLDVVVWLKNYFFSNAEPTKGLIFLIICVLNTQYYFSTINCCSVYRHFALQLRNYYQSWAGDETYTFGTTL